MESSFNTFVYANSYLPQSVTSLPAYTRRPSPQLRARREMTEHVAELSSDITNKRAKPWATLRVCSKAPAGTLPTFVEGEKITGSVTLDSGMSHSRHISCVKIIVSFFAYGRLMTKTSFGDFGPDDGFGRARLSSRLSKYPRSPPPRT
ncbi:hypothetical protein GGU10DRAFT_355071 [Lentinula aff. detonsa]|uniref:Uncharacterized protein n=1 Tax=Lentinula aff. detonsa TaxID=2804958 RepID=A0AA38KG81_9AGAR|nr:hypothetical protein GGU10DRAFT_355071 [Lentinula aff. detonsa]